MLVDVDALLGDAARVFAGQKGATHEPDRRLEQRLLAGDDLSRARPSGGGSRRRSRRGPCSARRGAPRGRRRRPPVDRLRGSAPGADFVVTGEGTVDRTTRPARPRARSSAPLATRTCAACSSVAASSSPPRGLDATRSPATRASARGPGGAGRRLGKTRVAEPPRPRRLCPGGRPSPARIRSGLSET